MRFARTFEKEGKQILALIDKTTAGEFIVQIETKGPIGRIMTHQVCQTEDQAVDFLEKLTVDDAFDYLGILLEVIGREKSLFPCPFCGNMITEIGNCNTCD